MRDGFPTLGTILKANGYTTGAMANVAVMAPQYKLDRGFDFYSCKSGVNERIADAASAEALDWIDQNSDRPFFIFVHYFDPHMPYSPPPPYDTLFTPTRSDVERKHVFPSVSQIGSLTPADWDKMQALYDGEIAFTDQAVRHLLEGLDQRGLSDNTLVVLLSDHGEEFCDHGAVGHGHTFYDELLKVPLICVLPGVIPENVRIPNQVRLLDVCPTILDLIGIGPEPHFEGVSLKPLMMGKDVPEEAARGKLLPAEIAYSEALHFRRPGEGKSVRAYPWKIIYNIGSMKTLLFNLGEDPGEQTNLADRAGEPLAVMDETLSRTMLDIGETWFLEIVGGESGARFAVNATPITPEGANRFGVVRLLDQEGRPKSLATVPNSAVSQTVVRLRDLEARDPMTLVFTLETERKPVQFDISLDGKPALENTYLGRSLSKPATMPFVEALAEEEAGSAAGQGNGPGKRPEPPYVLIWRSEGTYRGDTEVKLDPEMRRQLRAVGYVQ
jgi:hypothetical protein